jgi:hypothetical protein
MSIGPSGPLEPLLPRELRLEDAPPAHRGPSLAPSLALMSLAARTSERAGSAIPAPPPVVDYFSIDGEGPPARPPAAVTPLPPTKQIKQDKNIAACISQFLDPKDVSAMRQVQEAWKKAPMTINMDPRLLPFLVLLKNEMRSTQNDVISSQEIEDLCREITPLCREIPDSRLSRLINQAPNPSVKCHLMCQALLEKMGSLNYTIEEMDRVERTKKKEMIKVVIFTILLLIFVTLSLIVPACPLLFAILGSAFSGLLDVLFLGRAVTKHCSIQNEWRPLEKLLSHTPTLDKIAIAADHYMKGKHPQYNPAFFEEKRYSSLYSYLTDHRPQLMGSEPVTQAFVKAPARNDNLPRFYALPFGLA